MFSAWTDLFDRRLRNKPVDDAGLLPKPDHEIHSGIKAEIVTAKSDGLVSADSYEIHGTCRQFGN